MEVGSASNPLSAGADQTEQPFSRFKVDSKLLVNMYEYSQHFSLYIPSKTYYEMN